ncbi:MAG: hypothetical protein Q7J16_10735 [Candidatus Cloacimonadales bacterium]|nr:hypothetical protein [Candidatus Cloacimonadales bacterium]
MFSFSSIGEGWDEVEQKCKKPWQDQAGGSFERNPDKVEEEHLPSLYVLVPMLCVEMRNVRSSGNIINQLYVERDWLVTTLSIGTSEELFSCRVLFIYRVMYLTSILSWEERR